MQPSWYRDIVFLFKRLASPVRLQAMSSLIVYYAHPAHHYSHANKEMATVAAAADGVTFVDLYGEYPRFEIDADIEQQRLTDHDVVLLQFPMFWYSTPSILKEWQDLVLEHGFAYGSGGDKLEGKRMMIAVSGAGPEDAYTPGGYQHYPVRDFLRPLEQTARLCGMQFAAPYVLYDALKAPADGRLASHVESYKQLLLAIRDDQYDWDVADGCDVVQFGALPIKEGGQ